MKTKNTQDTEHGYVNGCGMAVDYDTVLTRASASQNPREYCAGGQQLLGDYGTLPAKPAHTPEYPTIKPWACKECGATTAETREHREVLAQRDKLQIELIGARLERGTMRAQHDELLAACKALVKTMANIGMDKSHMLSDHYHNARAAIANVEGEQ